MSSTESRVTIPRRAALAALLVVVVAASARAQGSAGGTVDFDPNRLKVQPELDVNANLTCGPCSTLWFANENTGSSAAFSGSCTGSPAIGIQEANFNGSSDAYDFAFNLWVNGAQYPGPGTFTTPCTYSGPTGSMSGLNVTYQLKASATDAVIRALASFQNPTGGSITVTVQLPVNVGSDTLTTVRATSSGDLTVTTADRWSVTSDTGPSDPVVTVVWQGPGTVATAVSSVVTSVFDCSAANGIGSQFSLTVPAGTTRRLMWFSALGNHGMAGCSNTVSASIASATRFDNNAALPADLTTDLGDTSTIVNWALGGAGGGADVAAIETKLDTDVRWVDEGELAASVTSITTPIAAIEGKLDTDVRWVDEGELAASQSSQTTSITTPIAAIEGKLDTDVRWVDEAELAATQAALTTEVNQNELAIAAVEAKLDNLDTSAGLGTKLDAIEMKLDDETRFTSDTELAVIEAKLDTDSRWVDEAELATSQSSQTASITGPLSALEGKLDTDVRWVDEAELATSQSSQTAALTTEINQNELAIAAVEAKLDNLDTTGGLGTKLDAIEMKLDDETRFTSDTELAVIEAKLDTDARWVDEAELAASQAAQTSGLTVEINQNEVAIAAVESKLDQMDVSGLGTKLDAIEMKLDDETRYTSDQELAVIEGKLDDETRYTSDAELSVVEAKLDDETRWTDDGELRLLQDHVDGRLDAVDTSIAAVESKLDAKQDAVDAIEGKLDDEVRWTDDAELAVIEGKLDDETRYTSDAELAVVEGKLDDETRYTSDAELAVVESKLDDETRWTDDGELADLQTHVDGRLDTVDDALAAVEGKLDAKQDAVEAIEGKLDDETRFTSDAELAVHEQTVVREIDVNEAKIDALEAKADLAATAIAAIEAKLDTTTEEEMLCILVEQDFLGQERISRWYLPEAFGGRLETARECLQQAYDGNVAAGLNVGNSANDIADGDDAVSRGDYKGAWDDYKRAYRKIVIGR